MYHFYKSKYQAQYKYYYSVQIRLTSQFDLDNMDIR